ncbi:hypothetical protein PanWU01x14_116400 [Parasponia andersonii]|uniref:Uncharacterized protein n=1 Tax=Parasponia andersonii TaxID=3476 RepID=A0A2P5CWS7_PARAD|nr:hypothetical protein PanWU01x14_116400 [Parasponia andersonii]
MGQAKPIGLLLRLGLTPTIYNRSTQAHIKGRADTIEKTWHLCNTCIESSQLYLENALFENESR